jgi:hypothetical protein
MVAVGTTSKDVAMCWRCDSRFPGIPIHAVMGGLNLGGVMERIIGETVEGLRRLRFVTSLPGTAPVGVPFMRWPTHTASG